MSGEGLQEGSVLDSVGHGEDTGFYAESPWRVLRGGGTGSGLCFNTSPHPGLSRAGLQGSKGGSRKVSEEATERVLAGEAGVG